MRLRAFPQIVALAVLAALLLPALSRAKDQVRTIYCLSFSPISRFEI